MKRWKKRASLQKSAEYEAIVKFIETYGILSAFHYEVDQPLNKIPKESKETKVGCGYNDVADFNDA